MSASSAGARGFKLTTIHGIEIRLDLSVAIVFALVVYGLGAGLFPQWHGDWSPERSWAVALSAGVLFFASLLAHELAHSVVAQRFGIDVPRITLFIFGGVSEMEREPDKPVAEFLIAIVGPAMSLLLAFLFIGFGSMLAPAGFAAKAVENPAEALASLGPSATLMLWLGPVNLMLGLFNLVPGFPLDGGRVFRAAVWWVTNDLQKATRWASNAGRGFAWLLMGYGALSLFNGQTVQGIWMILIGWFLQNAAAGGQVQLALREAVAGHKVGDLMRTRFGVVGPDLGLEDFVEQKVLRSGQLAWPVVDGERLLGIVGFDDVRSRLESDGPSAMVRDAMRPVAETLRPDMSGSDALQALLRATSDPLPVVEDGKLVGMLHRADIGVWLAAHHVRGGDGR